MEKRLKRDVVLTLLPVLLLAGIIFFLSAQTAELSSETSGKLTSLFGMIFHVRPGQQLSALDSVIRQLAHFAEYGAFGFFLRLHLLTWQKIKTTMKNSGLPLCMLVGVLYAVSDEIHQMFVPGRSAQVIDIFADSLGVLVGSLLLMLLTRCLSKRSKNL